jgi:alkylation response protein AidB-like acyl-CoA dehydrogenase
MGSPIGSPQDVLGAIREIAERDISTVATRVDRERSFPTEGLEALGAVGAYGLVVPDEHAGLSSLLTESLTLMASRSLQPAELAEAGAGLRTLMATMGRNRVRRLRAAGFDARAARHLSDLHTPDLM